MTMKVRDLWYIFKCAVAGWWNDNVPRLGASLAYYTLFAMAPILLVSIAIAGFFFGPEAARGWCSRCWKTPPPAATAPWLPWWDW